MQLAHAAYLCGPAVSCLPRILLTLHNAVSGTLQSITLGVIRKDY